MEYKNQNSDSMDGIWIVLISIVAIIFFTYSFWISLHTYISYISVHFYSIIVYPFFLLYIFLKKTTGLELSFLQSILYNTTQLCIQDKIFPISCARPPSSITFSQLSRGTIFGNLLISIYPITLAYLGYQRVNKFHPMNRFTKKHTLETFITEQKQNYPHLQLFAHFNPQLVNVMSGHLMGMKTSREFAIENQLITGSQSRKLKHISSGLTISQNDSKEIIPIVDRNKLITLLKNQLGNLWHGVDYIDDAEAILLARYLPVACCVNPDMSDNEFNRIKRESVELEEAFWFRASDDILNSEQFAPTGIDDEGGNTYDLHVRDFKCFDIQYLKDTYISPYIEYPVTRALLKKHAYTRSFIIAVIFEARKLGVAASCQMRWLRFYHRPMWALLSNIGRPSFFSENMGAVSHYQAESVAQTSIYQPHFDVAIRGFEYQLNSYYYENEDIEKMRENKNYQLIESSVFSKMDNNGFVSDLRQSTGVLESNEANVDI